MNQQQLDLLIFVSETILSIASLLIATIALVVSIRTFRQGKKPIIGLELQQQADYIYLVFTNHGDGIAKHVQIRSRVCQLSFSRAINFLPPNTSVSVELIAITTWNQIPPVERQIICSYKFLDCYHKCYEYKGIELLFH